MAAESECHASPQSRLPKHLLLRLPAVADNGAMDQPFDDPHRARMRDGAVTLYHTIARLDEAVSHLRADGYRIEMIDCRTADAFDRRMNEVFRFNELFGVHWSDGLDSLHDAFFHLGIDAASGLALCFLRYDVLNERDSHLARGILNLVEYNSRDYLLLSRRLLALVQSDDPRIDFGLLGGRRAQWNSKEWLNKNRGL